MNIIFDSPNFFDNGRRLEQGFQECLNKLKDMVSDGFIPDIIFPDVNVYRYVNY